MKWPKKLASHEIIIARTPTGLIIQAKGRLAVFIFGLIAVLLVLFGAKIVISVKIQQTEQTQHYQHVALPSVAID